MKTSRLFQHESDFFTSDDESADYEKESEGDLKDVELPEAAEIAGNPSVNDAGFHSLPEYSKHLKAREDGGQLFSLEAADSIAQTQQVKDEINRETDDLLRSTAWAIANMAFDDEKDEAMMFNDVLGSPHEDEERFYGEDGSGVFETTHIPSPPGLYEEKWKAEDSGGGFSTQNAHFSAVSSRPELFEDLKLQNITAEQPTASSLKTGVLKGVKSDEVGEKNQENSGVSEKFLVNGQSELQSKKGFIRKRWVIEDDSPIESFERLVPKMAINFPFELDNFQKRAIMHLEAMHNIFVAAHTSAGKTVVAEYAIALAMQKNRRIIYTSPIKALSNQKYRDFKQKFDSVGIVTGDVSINKQAACLIVTTEILLSALYHGDPMIEMLDTVVFDEIHYINDAERGVIWEETIILLPSEVNLVMLSATVQNYIDFSDWIGRTRKRDVFAILTLTRPVPLKHFIFVIDKEILLVDTNGKFNSEAYSKMMQYENAKNASKAAAIADKAKNGKGKAAPKSKTFFTKSEVSKNKTESSRLADLVTFLQKNERLPVVIFCFSRKKCDDFAHALRKLKVINSVNASKVHVFIKQSLSILNDEDKVLPQILFVSEILQCGVGVHHGGLLPIVKEMVEILFSRGLISILLATETFAMGVNMPARSVVFSSLRKHDGRSLRPLLSSEYTQMAGRAGRRGLDGYGYVYVFAPEGAPGRQELSLMIEHKSDPLQSQFRITFAMLLQRCLNPWMKITDLMSRSFQESMRMQQLEVANRNLSRLTKGLNSLEDIKCIFGEPAIEEYEELEAKYRGLSFETNTALWQAKKVLKPGRILMLHSLPSIASSCLAVILVADSGIYTPNSGPSFKCLVFTPGDHRIQDKNAARASRLEKLIPAYEKAENLQPKVLSSGFIDLADDGGNISSAIEDEYAGLRQEYRIYSNIRMKNISLISSGFLPNIDKIKFDNNNVQVAAVALELEKFRESFDKLPDTISKEKGQNNFPLEFIDSISAQEDLLKKLKQIKCHNCPKKEENQSIVLEKQKIKDAIEEIEFSMSDQSLKCFHSMKERMHFLRMTQYIDDSDILTSKGLLGCKIMTGDDVLLVEAFFCNVLQSLTPEEVASVIAVFCSFEDRTEQPFPTPGIMRAVNELLSIQNRFAAILNFRMIEMTAVDFRKSINPYASYIVYQWATGMSFADIMLRTTSPEGSLVRCFLRLDETLRRMKLAVGELGDPALVNVFDQASAVIRRDIIFMSSLYLQ